MDDMRKIVYSEYYYNCESYDLDVYFEYNNSVVFNTGKRTFASKGGHAIQCAQLRLISKCELAQYESPMEVKRYCRGDNLVIQGILSFFTGLPLTIYHSSESSYGVEAPKFQKKKVHLKIEKIDYTSDLKTLLTRLEEEPEQIISLLDRWRKAIYLKFESSDADLYYDEATLSFFHILELFGDSINRELKAKLQNNIEDMLYKHFDFYYLTAQKKKQLVEENKKAVQSLLIGDYLTLSIKVKYFLEKYNLLDDNIAFFIDNMIKVRNAIAHGRIAIQKNFIWPLSPFYNLGKDSYENIDFLFFLTGRMISAYIGITCWENEWNEAKAFLMPPYDTISKYLDKSITNIDLMLGNKYNITWRTLFNYYLKNPKSNIKNRLESTVKSAYIRAKVDEKNAFDLFNISLVFADSNDEEIQKKARDNIRIIIKNKWYGWSNFKDANAYMEFYGIDLKWFKHFLESRSYLSPKECNTEKAKSSPSKRTTRSRFFKWMKKRF